jgi:hypothetical protein
VIQLHMEYQAPSFKAGVRTFWQYPQALAPLTSTGLGDLLGHVSSAWTSTLSQSTHNGYTLATLVATDLNSDMGAVAVTNPGTLGGVASASPLDASVCWLINHKVGRRYRGGHPRTYLPGPRIEDLQNGVSWASASIGTLTSNWQNFVIDLESNSSVVTPLVPVNVSRYSGFTVVIHPKTGRAENVPTPRVGGPLIDKITGFSVNPIPGNQRNRLRGG